MTLNPLVPPDDNSGLPAVPLPSSAPAYLHPVFEAPRLPFSKMAIWGFVLSCVSVVIFGFLGGLGFWLSSRGLQAAKKGTARGRGLAIAGMIIGLIGFGFYTFARLSRLAG